MPTNGWLPFARLRRALFVLVFYFTAGLPSEGAVDVVSIFEKANKSVVVVLALDFSGQPVRQGSGFVISDGRTIITNYHVIVGAAQLVIRTPAGNTFPVRTALGINEEADVAVLQINAKTQLPPIPLGDSSLLKVGEEVIAIGSPEGLVNTVSTGIVSGLRNLSDKASYIQTTAPISSGSSGGPLLNAVGQVVAITTFLVKGGQNLNFCIPINYAKEMLKNPEPFSLSVLATRKLSKTSPLQGFWAYNTVCRSCKAQHASGTILIKGANGQLVIEGHITYTDGSEFTWVELAYTDGSTIWSYAVNDQGQVGTHVYKVLDGEMTSSWTMSNGASGTSFSRKLR